MPSQRLFFYFFPDWPTGTSRIDFWYLDKICWCCFSPLYVSLFVLKINWIELNFKYFVFFPYFLIYVYRMVFLNFSKYSGLISDMNTGRQCRLNFVFCYTERCTMFLLLSWTYSVLIANLWIWKRWTINRIEVIEPWQVIVKRAIRDYSTRFA